MICERIEAKLDPERVLVELPDTDEKLNPPGGTVLHHSKDREEMRRWAFALHPPRTAVQYKVTMPEDAATVV